MISNCGKDENGRYTGGVSGDQTGKEWHIIHWYNRPWDCVLRYPDEKIRKMISDMAKASAKNNCIGYDQWQRLTFWEELKKVNYKPENIKRKCEADCSSGVCSIVKAVGHRKNIKKLQDIPITTTHYMRDVFRKAGFEVLTDSKYLTSDAYLLPGDILLNISHHTATNLDVGSKVKTNVKPATKSTKKEPTKAEEGKSYVRVKTNGSGLNCRKKPTTVFSTVLGSFKNGTKVTLVEKTNKSWYKVTGKSINGKTITGYVASRWVEKIK